MNITRQQWKKHKETIKWFYEQPEGTAVWRKWENGKNWELTTKPGWYTEYTYVINDEYSEIRRAIADNKKVVFKIPDSGYYIEVKTNNPNYNFIVEPNFYRIKPEIKFPVYKKNDFMVVRFDNEIDCKIVFIFNKEKASFVKDIYIGKIIPILLNDKEFKNVLYDEDKGLWDGQPIWGWDEEDGIDRILCFYDAKNKNTFKSNCERNGYSPDFYKIYPHLNDELIIDIYNKLNFDS